MKNLIHKAGRWIKLYGFGTAILYAVYKAIDGVFAFLIKAVIPDNLDDIIVFESLNDFDLNSGALFEYMISKNLNKEYRFIWLIKHEIPSYLPENTYCFSIRKPSLLKNYYLYKARYIMYELYIPPKLNMKQKVIYLTHGGCTLKNVRGFNLVPDYVDYYLSTSEKYDQIMCNNYMINYPNDRMLHFGYPENDILFSGQGSELDKIGKQKYCFNILWMPTFRVLNDGRKDCEILSGTGIPLIEDECDFDRINEVLKENSSRLIIKIHPNQHPNTIGITQSYSNIVVLDGITVKEKNINTYGLMRDMDAFISDYSSAAYSFLLLNRQMAFVLNDFEYYKRGFIVDNYEDYLPGHLIYTIEDFFVFLEDVFEKNDKFSSDRTRVMDYLYEYKDGNSSKRLVDFLKIK